MADESRGSALVLAADDDLDTLNIIRMKLEAHGLKVVTARDGEEALRLVRQKAPSLIILDVMMPKLSGFKTARLIKFDSVLKGIPLILLTARTQEVDRSLGEQVGADLYVMKPFDPEQLLKDVQRLLKAAGGG